MCLHFFCRLHEAFEPISLVKAGGQAVSNEDEWVVRRRWDRSANTGKRVGYELDEYVLKVSIFTSIA